MRPLDTEVIFKSVKKTGRLIVFEIGNKIYGVGGEIISMILEKDFNIFKSSPSRIGLPDSPTPSSRALAEKYYPNSSDILKEISKQLNVNVEVQEKIINLLLDKIPENEIDVPNPEFKGPF